MMLRPLEFRDCVVDGPHFRNALSKHEKGLKRSNKRIKNVYVTAERLFKTMDQFHQAVDDFAAALANYYSPSEDSLDNISSNNISSVDPISPLRSSLSEVAETDDDLIIRAALGDFAQLLQNIEEARSTMLAPIKTTVLDEISELRSVWLAGQKTDPKLFLKETNSFCQRLEKYVSVKQKDQTEELDDQMSHERHKYLLRSFVYVNNIHEAEDLQKTKFIQTISLLMQMLSNFHHQAFDLFENFHGKMTAINMATQRYAEHCRQISFETLELKEKLLRTPWEQIQSTDASWIREGYLFSPVKKAMSTFWLKYFCVYNREQKKLTMTPYTQTRTSSEVPITETFTVQSSTRRASDSIDRRFCFDVETDRFSTITLQAQSDGDLQQWLRILDAKEPIYAHPTSKEVDPDETCLNDHTFQFVCNLISVIEENCLHVQGIYRISSQKSKIGPLVQQAMSPPGISNAVLAQQDPHTLTGILSHFFRHLDEPLLTYKLHDHFLSAIKQNASARLGELSRVIKQLPSVNLKFLKVLIQHLTRVDAESRQNNMTASNLSIVFAPNLLRSRELTVAAIMNTKFASLVIELMIKNFATLFESPSTSNEARSSNLIEPVYMTPVSVKTYKSIDSRQHSMHHTDPSIPVRRPPLSKFSSPYTPAVKASLFTRESSQSQEDVRTSHAPDTQGPARTGQRSELLKDARSIRRHMNDESIPQSTSGEPRVVPPVPLSIKLLPKHPIVQPSESADRKHLSDD